MAWSGTGTFDRNNGTNSGQETWQDDAAGVGTILADRHDAHDQDLADGIAACITKNGESKATATQLPATDGDLNLGSADYKWNDIYAKSLTLGTGIVSKSYDTIALAVADAANISVGDKLILAERISGYGGGATWDTITDVGNSLAIASSQSNIVTLKTDVSIQLILSSVPYSTFTIQPKQWGIALGGADDSTLWVAIDAAMSAGDNIDMQTGTSILGSGITFSNDAITINMAVGAEFKQADSTQTIDSLITVSGDRVTWERGKISANLTGNATYTGRGESMRWTGDYGTGNNMHFNESHDGSGGVSAGLYVTGERCLFDNVYCYDSRRTGVRCHGDYNTYKNLRFNEFSFKGFLKDSGPGGAAAEYTYVHVAHAYSSSATDLEVVLFDHDGVQDGKAIIDIGYFDTPNMTGPDQFKIVYVKDVTIRGYRGTHPTIDAHRTTVRFQQSIEKVQILDCVFPASINFDPSVEADVYIGDGTVIGDSVEVNSAIEDFAGTLTIEDGCSLKNLRASAITTSVSYPDTKINLGRLNYDGAATYTPNAVKNNAAVGARRMIAGNIKVDEPLSTTGTMKSRQVDGRWIGLSETQDAGCAQSGPARTFLVGSSDFPPRDTEGVQLGDIIRKRAPASGDTVAEYRVTTAGAACKTTWLAAHDYTVEGVDYWVFNGTNVYVLTTAGTSAGSGGPTGTGTGITDGTCVWDYVDTLAVYTSVAV